jgi:hypothetical protein
MKKPSTLRFRLREIVIRFVIAYPMCFYLYGSAGIALGCMSHFIDECIPMVLFSPIFVIVGPLGHDNEDRPNVFARVFFVTLVAIGVWTLLATIRQRRAPKE